MSHPNASNGVLEISPKLLGSPDEGLSAAKPLFKPLKEDNDYLIYSDGRLYSKKQNRFIKGKIDNVGYQVYALAIYNPLTSKMGKMLYAHRLVAEYFLEKPDGCDYVHHKDENRLNNDVSNLEWMTAKKNSQDYLLANPDCRKNIKKRYYLKDLDGEIWKVIPEKPQYSVSNMGRVVNNRTNRLIQIDTTMKYHRVSFNDKKHYMLHRLVYCVFNNDYDFDGYVIDHIDDNPANNRLDNLQKLTHSQNNYKRHNKGRFNDYPTAGVGVSAPKEETPEKSG